MRTLGWGGFDDDMIFTITVEIDVTMVEGLLPVWSAKAVKLFRAYDGRPESPTSSAIRYTNLLKKSPVIGKEMVGGSTSLPKR